MLKPKQAGERTQHHLLPVFSLLHEVETVSAPRTQCSGLGFLSAHFRKHSDMSRTQGDSSKDDQAGDKIKHDRQGVGVIGDRSGGGWLGLVFLSLLVWIQLAPFGNCSL